MSHIAKLMSKTIAERSTYPPSERWTNGERWKMERDGPVERQGLWTGMWEKLSSEEPQQYRVVWRLYRGEHRAALSHLSQFVLFWGCDQTNSKERQDNGDPEESEHQWRGAFLEWKIRFVWRRAFWLDFLVSLRATPDRIQQVKSGCVSAPHSASFSKNKGER